MMHLKKKMKDKKRNPGRVSNTFIIFTPLSITLFVGKKDKKNFVKNQAKDYTFIHFIRSRVEVLRQTRCGLVCKTNTALILRAEYSVRRRGYLIQPWNI